MSVLADDALEGRGLGTAGYEGALQYVEKAVTSYGLAPAGENGGFRQRVPLRNSVVVESRSSMKVRGAAGTKTLVYGKDYLLSADPLREQVSIQDAPVVFVGYGVSASALGYDDYGAGVDVKGKVVAFLSGAPAMLPSNERAYYSSGAVKEAEAIKRGAIGTISFTSARRSALPLGCERRHRQAGRLRLGGRAGQPQPGRPGAARVGVAEPLGRGGALCRGVEACRRGVRGGREEHAAGIRPGDPRVAHHAVHAHGCRERQPRRAPRGQRSDAEERTRRLRRPRGSLRARRGDERRRHLQRRARQRLRRRDRAGRGARVLGAAHAAPALRPVPVRDGRGAGPSRLRLLRAESHGAQGQPRGRSRTRHAVPVPPAARHRARTGRSTRRSRRR